mgnify:CR=1 FL=1
MFDKIRKAFGGSEKPKAETKQKIESAPEVEETAAPVADSNQQTTYRLHSLKWLYWRWYVLN